MSTPTGLQPLVDPPLSRAPDYTKVVRIRKVGDKYVADPERVHVDEGRCANIVFVFENAPRNSVFRRMHIQERNPSVVARPMPFSLPGSMRVMVITDDNTNPANQSRSFDYVLEVQEGDRKVEVDPGIDNDPPS